MKSVKYIGLDVHQATTTATVLDGTGKRVMRVVMKTESGAMVDFIKGLPGTLHATFEEGTYSGWLYELLVKRVFRLVVCDPRKNALLKSGSKSDAIDSDKLAELLKNGQLKPVYHGEKGAENLKQLVRSYSNLTQDVTRVMGRLKALYRSQVIGCAGKKVYGRRHRSEYYEKLTQAGVRGRAERLYQELDCLQLLRREAKRAMIEEARKNKAMKWLLTIPQFGPVRAAMLMGRVQTPHRFRTKRQFWAYCGMGLETRSSSDYRVVNGQVERKKKPVFVRGLNFNHNHDLKNVFKGAATAASSRSGPWKEFFEKRVESGTPKELARLTLARKMAAVALHVWKKGEAFNAEELLKTSAA